MLDSVYVKQKVSQSVSWSVSLTVCTAELIVCKSANWSVSQSVRCTEASQFLSQTVCRIGLHASQMTSQIVSMLHRKPDSQSTISQSARQFLTWSASQSVSQSVSHSARQGVCYTEGQSACRTVCRVDGKLGSQPVNRPSKLPINEFM